MKECHLAIDLGAESGRVIRGELGDDRRLRISEVHRFANVPVASGGGMRWDVDSLFGGILKGLAMSSTGGGAASLAVDAWGVDFVLLGADGRPVEAPYIYRDRRTQGAMEGFFGRMGRERLFDLTGIQLMQINTVFQLYSMVRDGSEALRKAAALLFMPDFFSYLLSGRKRSEFSISTTSQLYNPVAGRWEGEIFEALGADLSMMQEVVSPGTVLGTLSADLGGRTGLGEAKVVAVASHDTGSAVAAVPAGDESFAYISSGTWSLMGIESREPVINGKSLARNLTNEGGVAGSFRVLKNIMGLWLLQESRKSWAKKKRYDYAQLAALAGKAEPFRFMVDPDFDSFLAPPDMPEAIRRFLGMTGQSEPSDVGGYVRLILESLALACRHTLESLREVSARSIDRIHIIGGGSRNELLCSLTAGATGLPVYAGPAEATAAGNILVQAMALGKLKSLAEIREIVRRSFDLKVYEPADRERWEDAYVRWRKMKESVSAGAGGSHG